MFPGLRVVRFWLLVLACAAGLAAPAGAQESPVTGDWLIAHILSDPESLNPLTSNDATSANLLSYVFESLLRRHPQTLELVPHLATSRPQISADKLTYTFTLRRDARFQDGTPLTVHDVLFSLKAIKTPWVNAPFVRVYYQSLVDAERLDDDTIRLVAKEPYFRNEDILGGFSILPRHYYDPEGLLAPLSVRDLDAMSPDDTSPQAARARRFAEAFNTRFARNPMGSGPYRFRDWKTGQEVVLERDPDYWGTGKPGLDQPYLDRRVFRVFTNPDAALVALKAGQLDAMGLTPIQHLRQTQGRRFRKQFAKYLYYTPGYTYIGWNNAHPIFRDRRVRQAMTYLTNRQQMVQTILFGLGKVVDSPVYLFRPEYDQTLYSHPYDPQKARQLLGEAGWRDRDGDGLLDNVLDGQPVTFRFELKFNAGNEVRRSVALALQDELRKHGIAVELRQLDWTIFLDDVRHHRFDAVILGWAMPLTEPDGYQVWHSSQIANQGSNFISFRHPRVDAILETYRRTFDPQQRIALYREFQQILNREQPYTFLFMRQSILAVARRFHNVTIYPGGPRPLEWWVPKALQKYTTVLTP
ncbi:MAG: peptide-binding protein [Candidatus Tectimicrobiota bacterium]|nr:MAG: peptide-binding protein [Candidatus Tectomicrobia bacterium]